MERASWWVEDRQPEVLVGTCSHGLASSTDAPGPGHGNDPGVIYYAHPGSSLDMTLPRANYTLHRSFDGGGIWEFVDVIYRSTNISNGGAGYSDAHLLPQGEGEPQRLGMAFQRTIYEPGAEGGGYNMAFATIEV